MRTGPGWIAERWKEGDGQRQGWCGHIHQRDDTAERCARTAYPSGPDWGEWEIRQLGDGESPWAEPRRKVGSDRA